MQQNRLDRVLVSFADDRMRRQLSANRFHRLGLDRTEAADLQVQRGAAGDVADRVGGEIPERVVDERLEFDDEPAFHATLGATAEQSPAQQLQLLEVLQGFVLLFEPFGALVTKARLQGAQLALIIRRESANHPLELFHAVRQPLHIDVHTSQYTR